METERDKEKDRRRQRGKEKGRRRQQEVKKKRDGGRGLKKKRDGDRKGIEGEEDNTSFFVFAELPGITTIYKMHI